MSHEDYFDEIDQLMAAAAKLPDGLEQMQRVEQAVAIAEQASDLDLEFELQLNLAQAAFNCGQLEKTIVAVAWCFGMHDQDEARFGTEALLDVCTYAMTSLSSLPATTRPQIANLLDNIEERYVEAGYSLRAIYRARCFNALWMGDMDEADRTFDEMKKSPIDFTYEGAIWERLFDFDYLMQRGRLRAAFETAKPILDAEDDAHGTYCWLASFILLPLVQLGELRLAEQAERRSLDAIVQNPSFAECVGHHILYFVAISNPEAAVRLVDRCIGWALDAPALRESFELALASWVCIRRLRRTGHAEWPGHVAAEHIDGLVNGALVNDALVNDALVNGDLVAMDARLESFVTSSARRFDERNENSHFADLIRYRMAVADPAWAPTTDEPTDE